MENSAFEALMIGVNVFVFIIALSAAILLMTNVLDMVDYANEAAITGMNGSLAETVGVVHERLYTGNEMLAYYRKNNTKYNFYIRLSDVGSDMLLSGYINMTSIYSYFDNEYELKYKGISGNKDTYVFVLKQD